MSNGTATNGAETNDTHTNGTTTTESFSFNVAFTDSVNTGYAPGDEAHLTPEELWIGIKHGARHPYDFSSYIANCEILSGTKNEFVRRLTVGDGAVHSKSGMVLDQDVVLYPMLSIEATTIGLGAKTTILMTRDAGADSTESNLYFTASYALVVANTKPGSPEAEKIATEYTGLARKAAQDGVKSVRRWKLEGKLPKWKAEDERMGI